MRIILTVFIATGLFSACSNNNEKRQKAELEDSVKSLLSRFSTAVQTSDANSLLSCLDDSSGFYWIPAGTQKCFSRDSLSRFFLADSSKYQSSDWKDLEVSVINDRLASYKGKLEFNADAGKKTTFEEGTLVKRNSGWKLLFGHSSLSN